VELIAEQGLEGLREATATWINTAMQLERQRHPGAEPYERTAERRG
jgi:hypothetical protein